MKSWANLMIIWEGTEKPPFTTGLFADFQGVQKGEEAPVEDEKRHGEHRKGISSCSSATNCFGGEEDAQE